jgi:HEAT repeat protein
VVGRIGPAATAARNELLRLLRDQSADVRKVAVEALAALGPAPGVLSTVSTLLSDDSIQLRASVLQAVGRLGTGQEAVALLAPALQDAVPFIRHAAVEGLIALGQPGRATLEGALDDEDEDIRELAAKALGGD